VYESVAISGVWPSLGSANRIPFDPFEAHESDQTIIPEHALDNSGRRQEVWLDK
jgi:hypothetical protein